MHELLEVAESRGGGLIFARDLAELGLRPSGLKGALAAGDVYRVRRGVYARPPVSSSRARSEQHRLLVRATSALAGPALVVSHESAAAMHRLPIIGPWPERVSVIRAAGSGGSSQSTIHSRLARTEPDTVMIDGVRVTSLARTLADVACTSSLLVGVTMLDSALATRSVAKELVAQQLDAIRPRYGLASALASLDFADGRSGSAGESLSRVRIFQLGFEAPELQVEVTAGGRRFEVDFGWEGIRRFGEFDGLIKYTRAAELSGMSVEEVVVQEKIREDLIRESTNRTFTRWLWGEALDARLFERRLSDAGVPRVPRVRRSGSVSPHTL